MEQVNLSQKRPGARSVEIQPVHNAKVVELIRNVWVAILATLMRNMRLTAGDGLFCTESDEILHQDQAHTNQELDTPGNPVTPVTRNTSNIQSRDRAMASYQISQL